MLKTAKVVGLNSDTAAALALISPWFVSDQGEGGQRFFLSIVSCECEDAFSKVRQSLSLAEEEAITSTEPAALRLPKILGQIKDYLKDADNFAALLVAVVEDNEGTALYLLSEGEGLIANLCRDGKENNLPGLGDGQVVSGILKEGDRIVLSTQSLADFLGTHSVSLSKIPIENFEDEVESFLPEAQTNPLAAIVLEKEVEVKEESTEPVLKELNNKIDIPKPSLPRITPNLGGVLQAIRPHSKKSVLILAVAILLGAGIVGGVTYKKRQDAKVTSQFTQALNQAREAMDKSNSEKDSDPPAALSALADAKKYVLEALSIKPNQSEALSLKDQIEKASPAILKVNSVENFPVWLDLGLIKQGFRASNLSLSHGNILILDNNKQTLVSINTKTKSHEILAGSEKIGEAKITSLNGGVSWIYSDDKGLLRIEDDKIVNVAKQDKDWGDIADIYGFAGNVYVLDEGKNQIWKYMPIASGFSDKREYLQSGVKANFAGAKRMQIESSIYILKGGGEILRFTQGKPDFFAYSGLDKPVKDARSFFVSSETDNLYLLDGDNSRLLVLDKKGAYKAQYQSDKFSQFSDLVVDEEGKKVYLLDGSKIYSMDLK